MYLDLQHSRVLCKESRPSAAFAFASDRGGCHRNINASVRHTILIRQQVRRTMEESIANLIRTETSNLSFVRSMKTRLDREIHSVMALQTVSCKEQSLLGTDLQNRVKEMSGIMCVFVIWVITSFVLSLLIVASWSYDRDGAVHT
ncbi:hypothetical protein EON65_05620 [archaeon]|nr:MAG: hypothetical protein EON65_05620 [archaeon]